MDDRNLVAVAEQAAATSKVRSGGYFAGCTVKSDDGRVFLGCLLEYRNSSLNQDPIANAIATARSEGARRIVRVGLYSPTGKELPGIPLSTLQRLEEVATLDLVIIFSSGAGERVARSLKDLLEEASKV